jgi:hypothetical protein
LAVKFKTYFSKYVSNMPAGNNWHGNSWAFRGAPATAFILQSLW